MITSTEARTTDLGRANSRCDSCATPARVLVILTSGHDLVFCEHHTRQYKAALKPIAVLIEHLPDSGQAVGLLYEPYVPDARRRCHPRPAPTSRSSP